jgi:hypothetical protein
MGLEPAMPASERPQTYAIGGAATWIGLSTDYYGIQIRLITKGYFLLVLGNVSLREIFGRAGKEEMGRWRKSSAEQPYCSYLPVHYLGDPINNEMNKVCSLDERRETTTECYLQNTGKSPRGRTRRKWGSNIEMGPK